MGEIVSALVRDTPLPHMFCVRQRFPRPRIDPKALPALVDAELSRPDIAERIRPGMRIALTAGSRGVANIALILRQAARFCQSRGALPFVVAAMGSHGGATAEGQRKILEEYGITEASVGCPVCTEMDVKQIGRNEEGEPVFIDRRAAEADGILVIGRVKPHTAFRGPYESGIMKMMVIGLGKQTGASLCHKEGFGQMAHRIPLFGRAILRQAPIIGALAILENAYDETCQLTALSTEEIEPREPVLLKQAFTYMPRILVDACDVLVVDQIGKDYSGDGMDPNITGTFCTPYATGGIQSQRVAVLDVSDASHGNAMGVGFASATTQRLYQKIDMDAMYPNAITATVLGGVRIPVVMPNDRECIQLCVRTCTGIDHSAPRIVRIPNSLHLEYIQLSAAYGPVLETIPGLEIADGPLPFAFDPQGNLF